MLIQYLGKSMFALQLLVETVQRYALVFELPAETMCSILPVVTRTLGLSVINTWPTLVLPASAGRSLLLGVSQ